MPTFVDASVFIAYYNEDDVHHKRAAGLWQKIEAEQPFTSDYIFNEVVGVSLRKFGKARAVNIGQKILNTIFIIDVDRHSLDSAWRIFSRIDSTLSLVDCTNLVVMKLAGSNKIATFDKEFKNVKDITIV